MSKLTDGFNGADLRNVCTEAAMFAIREDRGYVVSEDFMKASRKLIESKKLETKLEYSKVLCVCFETDRSVAYEKQHSLSLLSFHSLVYYY